MRSSSANRLLDLPTELLDIILCFVDASSLACLSRVCRTLQLLIEPHLYHTVSLRNPHGEIISSAIERIPVRAEFVRELRIHYHDVADETDAPVQLDTLSPTIAQLYNLESLLIKGVNGGGPMSLGLYRYMEQSKKFEDLLLEATMPDSQVLRSLRTCIINLSEQGSWELAQLDALFLLPTLQRLTIANARMACFTSFSSAEPRSTDLRELTLITCDIRPSHLRDILSMPKALEHFTTKGSAWRARSVSGDDRASNLDALRMHASSLVTLDLDLFLDDDRPPIQPLAFIDFVALRRLAIELWIIRGHIEQGILSQKALLPRGLEELTLKCAVQHIDLESYYLDPIYRWLQDGALPELKKIVLETTTPIPNVPKAMFRGGQTVGQTFAAVGVDLSMMEEAPGGYVPFECDCCWYRYRNPGWRLAYTNFY